MNRLIIMLLCMCCLAPAAQAQSTGSAPVSYQKSDTIRALSNLYQRKRKGGTARAIVFGLLGLTAIINTANAEGGGDGGAYIMIGFSAAMVGTGIAQTNKYNALNLEQTVHSYKSGTPLPATLKKKFKQKDFRL
ncbi:MAG: hypothetical protein JNL17_14140 [Cyclobacteriaceae bacterium]|nr:hypothetical protein [Cyclobacteriaceae bacterium]